MNFTECTPIQEHAIPVILEGRDLIGVAQTGTGKTAAFLLPILSKLSDGGYPEDSINCVIMSPTRELAQQIDQAMEGFSYYMSVSSVAVYGGNDGIRYEQEKKGLAKGADVIIATPGRLISHLNLGNVDLSKVSFFVLDEADRMLDMGFSDDIMTIVKHLPKERQTIMFSATMPRKIQDLARTILRDPVEVKLAVSRPADKIVQSAYICYDAQKIELVKKIFAAQPPAACHHLRFFQTEGEGHGYRAEACRIQRRRHALRLGPARTRRGDVSVQGTANQRAGGHRHRGARHRHRRHTARHQFRRASRCRGLRAPHRTHGPCQQRR